MLTPEEITLIESMRAEITQSVENQDLGLQYELQSVEEKIIETIAGAVSVIIYTPVGEQKGGWPVFVNIHGGGFVLSRAYMDGPYCRRIANCANCIVVNVDYLLAPEYPFPTALEQCYGVVHWIWNNATKLYIDKNRIAIGGYSAGGNLSTAVCQLLQESRDFQLLCQVLCYPPLDLVQDPANKSISSDKAGIPIEVARLFNKCYAYELETRKNPLVSPVYADNLSELPSALIITAEHDSLAKEAIHYVQLLREAGVYVKHKHYLGVDHAFTHEPTKTANDAWDLICNYLYEKFYYL